MRADGTHHRSLQRSAHKRSRRFMSIAGATSPLPAFSPNCNPPCEDSSHSYVAASPGADRGTGRQLQAGCTDCVQRLDAVTHGRPTLVFTTAENSRPTFTRTICTRAAEHSESASPPVMAFISVCMNNCRHCHCMLTAVRSSGMQPSVRFQGRGVRLRHTHVPATYS